MPLNCVRLVRYDSYKETITETFEDKRLSSMEAILGYVPLHTAHELLLAHKTPDQLFRAYKQGG